MTKVPQEILISLSVLIKLNLKQFGSIVGLRNIKFERVFVNEDIM